MTVTACEVMTSWQYVNMLIYFIICTFQPMLLNRVPSGNQLAEKLLASQLPSNSATTAAAVTDVSSSVKPTRPVSVTATKQSTADITSMSLASLFENTESGQFGLGFGSGGLLGLRGAMPKMPSFRVWFCCLLCNYYDYCLSVDVLELAAARTVEI